MTIISSISLQDLVIPTIILPMGHKQYFLFRNNFQVLLRTLLIGCFVILTSCASKDMTAKISKLETENIALKTQVSKLSTELSTLSEDVILLKGQGQSFDPVMEQKEVVQAQEITYKDDRDPFFEESISAEEETLVITNQDLQNVKWGSTKITSSASPSKKKKLKAKASQSQAKIDYQKAYQEFKNKNYEKCRTLMHAFIQKYPSHAHTDNAHFWIGETYYANGAYAKADVFYKNVIQNFPKGNKVPDAMYRSASSALKMSQNSIAKQSFEILIKKYPKTIAAGKAKKTLKTIK